MAPAMLLCTRCGSDHVIPLTFPSVLVEQLFLEAPDRPVAKCVDCSHRVTAAEVTVQEGEFAED
jgi:hypothetical protein